jgi:exopolysaccharide biosynthesis polyprenyl glycosylphosphotransferase
VEASEQEDIRTLEARTWVAGAPLRPRSRFQRRSIFPWSNAPIREGSLSRPILRRDAAYRRSLALSDVLSTIGAIALATLLVGGELSRTALVIAPFVVLLAKMIGLYDRDELLVHKTTLDEAPGLFQVATVFTLGAWLVEESAGTAGFSATQAGVLWPSLVALLVLGRATARRAVQALTPAERCLVIGNASAAESLNQSFERGSAAAATVVGRMPLEYGRRHGEDVPGVVVPSAVPFLGDLDNLQQVLRAHRVDRVLVVPGAGAADELLVVTRAAKALGVRVSVVPRLFEVVGSSAAFDDVEGTTLLGLRRYGLSRSSWRLKRTLDIVVTVGVLLLLSPVLLLIALAIKLDDRGPVFFRQRRIGYDGREFEMVKFRTMAEDAERRKLELLSLNEAEGLFKIEDDPRITRVGRVLRKTSLDELPQLINVLGGDMSLVGPRPLVPDDDERIRGWDRRRLDVPPGMTGHWQILGSSRVPLGEMVKIDYLYGANWSLWGDLKILLRTVPYVLARRGQ